MNIDNIRNLHIELTTKCNARCPMCLRNVAGYPYNAGYPLTELSLQDYKSILSPAFLKQIEIVNFNGNLGDFSVANDASEILHYTADNVGQVQVETNGGVRTPNWWAGLARDNVVIQFALDGLEDTHSLYRIDTSYQKVLDNAIAFINAGGNATWKMIVFEHNKHQIEQCRELSIEWGFEHFLLIDDSERIESSVFSRNGEFSYWIGSDGPARSSINIQEEKYTLDEFKVITQDVNQEALITCHDHIGAKQIYIAGDGSVYPCCFTGAFPNTMLHPGNEQLKKIVKENNALENGLEHSIKWFNKLYESWDKPNVNLGKLLTCLRTCSKQ
jgi:MoaA/NifB/PqqE/SkfB family radical SAM enzyme